MRTIDPWSVASNFQCSMMILARSLSGSDTALMLCMAAAMFWNRSAAGRAVKTCRKTPMNTIRRRAQAKRTRAARIVLVVIDAMNIVFCSIVTAA